MLPFVRRAATPVLVIVGLYAGFTLWREARPGDVLRARLGQPVVWLFLAFMGWAAISLLWTPVPMRGLQSLSTAFLLVVCALFIFEFPLSKNAPRFLAIGLSIGSAIIAFDLMTGSRVIHLVHARPDDFRYNMVAVSFVVLASALILQIEKIKTSLWIVTLICLAAGVFASQSETAKLSLLIMPIVLIAAKLLRLNHSGLVVIVGLAALWLLAGFGMSSFLQLEMIVPADFWSHGAARERLIVWNGFTAFAQAGIPWGWGLEATSAPEATRFITTASDAIKAGVVGHLHSHDNILQIAAELGVPGLLLGFALNAKLIAGTSHLPSNRRPYIIVFFATVLIVAIISHGLWQSWWWAAVLIAAYFFFAGVASETSVRSRPQDLEKLISKPFVQAVASALLTFITAKILRSHFLSPYESVELFWQNIAMGFAASYVSARFMFFVTKPSVTRAYGYGIPITAIVFGFLAVIVALGRLDYLRLELVLNYIFATFLVSGFAYWFEARQTFRFHCLSEESLSHFDRLASVSVSLLKPMQIVSWRESDGIIVDFTKAISSEQKRVLAFSALNGVKTFDETEVIEKFEGAIPADHVAHIAKVTPDDLGLYHIIKRVIDFLAVICLLPLFLVFILIAAVAIKMDDGGSIFFRQNRIGYKGRKFLVWKLRTMRETASEFGSEYTLENDERITRVGRFLRRSRIDEFPQIFNVLKGEMSWIGPRPESAPLAEWYGDEIDLYDFRHIVRPGITGWAAIRQGNVGAVDAAKQKLYYDFFYIKNYSLELDLLIALKTMKIMVSGFGAR